MTEDHNCLLDFFIQTKPYRYRSGKIILHPDDNYCDVYYIESGYVKVYSLTENGDEKLHIIYKPEEIFPWIWVFRNVSKHLYYEAMGTVVLRKRSKEEFLKFLGTISDPKENCHLLFELANKIIDVLDVHVDRVDTLEQTKAYPRIISMLLFLAKRFGKSEGSAVLIDAPITHQDIASSINMTRETASRELEKLEKKGLLKYMGHLLFITDVGKLSEELEKYFERKPL